MLEQSDSVYYRGLLPVARLAHAEDRFRHLFPFTSVNRLCFSRCSEFPYTTDCPCIGVDRRGNYGVDRYPFPKLGWDESDPDQTIGDAADAADAVAIALAALPANAVDIWVGQSDRHGNRAAVTDN